MASLGIQNYDQRYHFLMSIPITPYPVQLILMIVTWVFSTTSFGEEATQGTIQSKLKESYYEEEAQSEPTALLRENIHQYIARVGRLSNTAIETGSISYQQAIVCAYENSITQQILEIKSNWRIEASKRGGQFVSDYENRNIAAQVCRAPVIRDKQTKSSIVARYQALDNQIHISNQAGSLAIIHEAGHTLQRESIDSPGKRPIPNYFPELSSFQDISRNNLKQVAGVDAKKFDRLSYLLNQEEFEVRLQDLNRFHFIIYGHPITNLSQALQALLSLEIPMTYEEIENILQELDFHLSKAEFTRIKDVARSIRLEKQDAFEDAYELADIRRLALELFPPIWPKVLRKIILESPGHL